MGKRAIALAGGGPAAGLHIGALMAFEEADIEFDVWALSCIGAWVGIVYNTRDGKRKAHKTYEFFRDHVFRDDKTYKWFSVNRAFAPDFQKYAEAWRDFAVQRTDASLFDPAGMATAWLNSVRFWSDPARFASRAELSAWWLNDVLAVNPVSRFMTSMIYRSKINGVANIYYPDSAFLKSLEIEKLATLDDTEIYHNAWNLDRQELQLFHNHPARHQGRGKKPEYRAITAQSLCACSALPYVEETVWVEDEHDPTKGADYCEGALIDTVNFEDLLIDHHHNIEQPEQRLQEIWVSRIVDFEQVRKPQNLHDGLANLCMLFAAEVGSNDVKLFKQHLAKMPGHAPEDKPELLEIPILKNTQVSFDWTVSNLERGIKEGYEAATKRIEEYRDAKKASPAHLGNGHLPPTKSKRSPAVLKKGNGVGRHPQQASPTQ